MKGKVKLLCVGVILAMASLAPMTASADVRLGGEWTTAVDTVHADEMDWFLNSELLIKTTLREDDLKFVTELSADLDKAENDWELTDRVERLYVSLYFPEYDVTLGKQQINWGTGRAWSPSDVFNPPYAQDPDRRRNGVNAALIRIPHDPLSFSSLVVAEDEANDGIAWGGRYHGNASGTDWSMFYVNKDDNAIIGGDASTDFLGLGVHTEATWEPDYYLNDDGRFLWLLGADYSWFNGRVVWLGEYLYDSTGDDTIQRQLARLWDPLVNLSKHYLFNQLSVGYDEFSNASVHLLSNLDDKSHMLSVNHTTMLDSQWNWSVGASTYFGDDNTEFGMGPDYTLTTSLKYQF